MPKPKVIKLEDDILFIMARMYWSDDGLSGKIPEGQLDRETYIKVDKALKAAGGKWDRKSKSHVFPFDPRKQIMDFISEEAITIERDGFFQTPKKVVEKMLSLLPLASGSDIKYLEPSAGLGAIAKVLIEYGVNPLRLVCVEKNRDRCEEIKKIFSNVICCDFLNWKSFPPEYFDRIYMNPPFEEGQDIEHVRYAYDLLKTGGALISVMCAGPFFRQNKKSIEFAEWLNAIESKIYDLPSGSFKESGTMVETKLLILNK